jgi:hypothetical protein
MDDVARCRQCGASIIPGKGQGFWHSSPLDDGHNKIWICRECFWKQAEIDQVVGSAFEIDQSKDEKTK